jgi:hypothetical protein
MKSTMETARARLAPLLEGHELTAGMSIRIYGDHLILARSDPETEAGTADRVRLTRLSASRYGLSVKRHTGRWERTPFSGTLKEMVQVMHTFMQHLVAVW